MADLIDRQAAIDALQKEINKVKPPFDDVIGSIRCGVRLARNIIEDLPSAQPDHNADISKKVDGDCISRQWLMECVSEGWIKFDTEKDENRFIHLVRDIAPSAQPEAKWTPCSKRMPEEGQKCLVCDKGSIGIDTHIGHGNPYNWKWYTRDYEAWIPFPEPYRGGGTE